MSGVGAHSARMPFRLHFAGVGPQRTGTSWLQRLLQHHPQLCFPKGIIEPMFFDLYYEQGLARYTAHFVHRTDDQLCGDITPTYFDLEVVPARIRRISAECKIIINLRHPVERALSLYRHHLSKGRVNGAFGEAILQMPRILDAGHYAGHIPCWLNTFGLERVTFVLFDDIKLNPEAVLKQICHFLEISQIAMPTGSDEKFNTFTMPRFPKVAGLTARLVTLLQTKGAYQIIELGKRMRLKRLIYAGGQDQGPKLTISEQKQLLEKYEADIVFVENLLGRKLLTWREFI